MEVQVTHHLTPRADLGLYNMTELFFFPSYLSFFKTQSQGPASLVHGMCDDHRHVPATPHASSGISLLNIPWTCRETDPLWPGIWLVLDWGLL